MRSCEGAHKNYDKHANGKTQVGSLPSWMHVEGRVAWYVFRDSYQMLPDGWTKFMEKVRSLSNIKLAGPPGDVYVCNPMEHKGDEKSMITILWIPVKA